MSLHDFAVGLFAISVDVALVLLGLAFLFTVIRIMVGPTLPDRVLGLDMLTSVDTGFTLYVDIAIALGLVGFLATVAFARFIQARGKTEEERFEALPFRDPQARHVEPLEEGKTK